MSTPDHRSTSPPFTVADTSFECWIVDDKSRFEWRAHNARIKIGRNELAGTYWARIDGKRVGFVYPTLRAAMLSAVVAYGGKWKTSATLGQR